jgi:hypothetical protein
MMAVWRAGMSSRPAAAWRKVSPPRHRRNREWRSLARTNPAGRGKPACVYENVRFAMTVGDLQGDVFSKAGRLNFCVAKFCYRGAISGLIEFPRSKN